MERLLLLWDELDDWLGATRHVVSSSVRDLAGAAAPLATASSAVGVWLAMPQYRFAAVLLGVAASLWAGVRQGS